MVNGSDKLAVLGGDPVCSVEWPAWPVWDEKDEASVLEALRSGGWGIRPGPNPVSEFACRFAGAHKARYALCCCNGTIALMIALRAAGVLPGDEVIIPAYTFMATATAAIGIGAVPIVVDVDPDTLNMDPARIEEAVRARTKAVLPVHIAGMPAAMDEINAMARMYGLMVVEDCAQAHLAEYRGTPVGTLGHVGAFSFQSSKNLNAGEGGVVVTNDAEMYRIAHAFHHCGRDPDEGDWYEHPFMGQNFRMGQLQAALLMSQMDRLPEQHRLRQENGRYLAERLSAIDGIRVIGWPWSEKVTSASYHLFIFTYDSETFGGIASSTFCEALRREGVPCHGGYAHSLQDFDLFDDPFVKRMLGDRRPDYRKMDTPVSRRMVRQSVWLKQAQLLADRGAMDQVAAAVQKLRDHAGDLPGLAS
jgi:dTDP-4-amino-4,6-dideoxygalactose transaminase